MTFLPKHKQKLALSPYIRLSRSHSHVILFGIAYAQASLQHSVLAVHTDEPTYMHTHTHVYLHICTLYMYVCLLCRCNFLEKVLAKMARECQARGRAEIYAAVLEYAGAFPLSYPHLPLQTMFAHLIAQLQLMRRSIDLHLSATSRSLLL